MSGLGGADRGRGSAQTFSVIKIVKCLPKTVISALSIDVDGVVTSCRRCRGSIRHGEEFCSQDCAINYWGRLRQENGKASGHWFCSLPGCEKPCYVEKSGRVHDYCSRTHAVEHKKMREGQAGSWLFSWLPRRSVSSHQQHSGTSKFSSGTSTPPSSTAVVGGHPARTSGGREAKMATNIDCQGKQRGRCSSCACDGYDGGSEKKKCIACGHPPGKHQNLSTSSSQQDSYHSNAFNTPQWSVGNTDSSDVGSSPSDSSDNDQDLSSRVRSDGGSHRPAPTAAPSLWQGWASALTSLFTQQQAPSKNAKPQQASPRKRTQSAGLARPVAAPSRQVPVQQPIPAIPQAPFMQAQQQSIPFSQGQQVCKLPGCNRPRFVESDGKVHDYCGKTHALQYAQQYAPQIPQHLQCKTPGCKKQRHPNGKGGFFDYCSIYCRENGLTSASTPNLQAAAGFGTCIVPGCTRPKYCDPANGRIHDYCGRTHASKARALGLQPSNPSMIRSANRQEFGQISQQFTRDWKKGTCPTVDYVYIVSNSALETRWSAYRQNLQNQNVEEYYHGTKLVCNLSSMPCTNTDCGVCGISNMGLDRRCIQKNINFQRFGHGFYLAPNSSKCHDYTQGANGYRAMMLCAVCPGRKYILQTDHVNLKGPPQGYDCVYGQEGSSLNYAEIVVYNPDAVVPRYIIVYQKDGMHKIAK